MNLPPTEGFLEIDSRHGFSPSFVPRFRCLSVFCSFSSRIAVSVVLFVLLAWTSSLDTCISYPNHTKLVPFGTRPLDLFVKTRCASEKQSPRPPILTTQAYIVHSTYYYVGPYTTREFGAFAKVHRKDSEADVQSHQGKRVALNVLGAVSLTLFWRYSCREKRL